MEIYEHWWKAYKLLLYMLPRRDVYIASVNDTKNIKTAPWNSSADLSGTLLVLLFNRKILQKKSMARMIKDIEKGNKDKQGLFTLERQRIRSYKIKICRQNWSSFQSFYNDSSFKIQIQYIVWSELLFCTKLEERGGENSTEIQPYH